MDSLLVERWRRVCEELGDGGKEYSEKLMEELEEESAEQFAFVEEEIEEEEEMIETVEKLIAAETEVLKRKEQELACLQAVGSFHANQPYEHEMALPLLAAAIDALHLPDDNARKASLVETKAAVVMETSSTVERINAILTAQRLCRGGMWQDFAKMNVKDVLAEDLIKRRF
ncbi:hypothetical protein GUITHDRAFT_140189 [Guillardia theta CCMP2712]|uniref:Uncharacterized protein n=2 Tax=Guillardia theta TaxID=55529 RepID=L1J6M8_GUITC|nr:hypothetical protein GUITHDRAFT_140189 [Guillardia theta CCMP2712]EKX43735.1 hypothetical protein GUITHDRAFT_140189 [Guillardia theta CCMP2712]|eukprot:XP_005830715.1 hypothetical protein GUITHDRAFT_140189 [Guillardia theta CCMP2712]